MIIFLQLVWRNVIGVFHMKRSFLFSILEWWGFVKKWCGWIRLYVCYAKIAVLVNGDTTRQIKTKRGVRQGDPLSPYLFLVVAKCLARMTEKAIRNNLLKGLGPFVVSKFTLIQFADDTFFFCETKKRYMRNLKFLQLLFEWASNLKVNKEKTELYYARLIYKKAIRLANILVCRVKSLPTKYLGVPLSNSSL